MAGPSWCLCAVFAPSLPLCRWCCSRGSEAAGRWYVKTRGWIDAVNGEKLTLPTFYSYVIVLASRGQRSADIRCNRSQNDIALSVDAFESASGFRTCPEGNGAPFHVGTVEVRPTVVGSQHKTRNNPAKHRACTAHCVRHWKNGRVWRSRSLQPPWSLAGFSPALRTDNTSRQRLCHIATTQCHMPIAAGFIEPAVSGRPVAPERCKNQTGLRLRGR